MSVFLLDVNVLLALTDPMHVHHDPAHRWYAAKGRAAWATCPLTENGFVRVASHPTYPNRPGDAPAVLAVLREFCADAGHSFWPDNVSLRDALSTSAAITNSQITDVYLLSLAVHTGGRLATFDRRISTAAVRGGSKALELIPA